MYEDFVSLEKFDMARLKGAHKRLDKVDRSVIFCIRIQFAQKRGCWITTGLFFDFFKSAQTAR